MALPLTLIIILGEIDLSVESMAGLASAVLGFMWAAGVPLEIAIPVVLVIGAAGGLLNGLLVARGGLPSLVVTLGTLALFRGLALIILGPIGASASSRPGSPSSGSATCPGTPIPWSFVVFLVARTGARHRAPPDVDRPPDLRDRQERRHRPLLRGPGHPPPDRACSSSSGTVAALAGVILTARLSSARADAGRGMTLTVVTVVLLGRRQHLRRVRARSRAPSSPSSTVAVMQNALRLASVSVEVQSIALGLLLILSVVIPTFAHQAKSAVDRVRKAPTSAGRRIADGEPALIHRHRGGTILKLNSAGRWLAIAGTAVIVLSACGGSTRHHGSRGHRRLPRPPRLPRQLRLPRHRRPRQP